MSAVQQGYHSYSCTVKAIYSSLPLKVLFSLLSHVVVGQSVDAFPPALLLRGQVQVRQDLPRRARAPLCFEGRKKDVNQSRNYVCR